MKIKYLLAFAITACMASACKKNSQFPEELPTTAQEADAPLIRDSISYRVDGITHNVSRHSSWRGSGMYQPYSKVDSIVGNTYYISGIKDSILYSRNYQIYDDHPTIEVIFIKTYHTAEMTPNGMRPLNEKELFTAGARNYAIDFGRDNKQNGVAFRFPGGYQTDGSDSFYAPQRLSADAQKDSKFEITSFKKSKSGIYILEATFSATAYNDKNESKKIENGYLRIVAGYLDQQ